MTPNSLLIILITAVWVSVSTLSAATTNAAASIGPSVAGQVPVYTDTTGQLMTPSSSLTNFTFVTPVITVPGGYYHGATLTPWVATNNSISLQWRKASQVFEFTGANGEWTPFTANSGSGGSGAGALDGQDEGVWSMVTGTLTNGVSGARSAVVNFIFGTNSFAVLTRIRTPSVLSTDADGYELYAGLGDSTGNAAPGDGAYFYYLHSVSNGVWCAKTSSNASGTAFASGAPTTPPTVAINTWYDLLLEGSSSVVNFWVSSNGGTTWQFIGYSTTHIVTASANSTGMEAYIRKVGGSVGTTSVTAYLGRVELWPNRN